MIGFIDCSGPELKQPNLSLQLNFANCLRSLVIVMTLRSHTSRIAHRKRDFCSLGEESVAGKNRNLHYISKLSVELSLVKRFLSLFLLTNHESIELCHPRYPFCAAY